MLLGKNAALTAAIISTVVTSGVICGPEAFTANASDLTTHATAKVVNETFTKVYIKKATNNGMVFSVENGTITENNDGSITIANKDGSEVKLRSSSPLSDGSVDQVSYRIDGKIITASYSNSIVEGVRVPVVTQGVAGCVFGTIATIGSIKSIPLTGDVSAWPAFAVAGGTAAMASYECATIGKS